MDYLNRYLPQPAIEAMERARSWDQAMTTLFAARTSAEHAALKNQLVCIIKTYVVDNDWSRKIVQTNSGGAALLAHEIQKYIRVNKIKIFDPTFAEAFIHDHCNKYAFHMQYLRAY